MDIIGDIINKAIKDHFKIVEFDYGMATYNILENKWYDLFLFSGEEITLEKLNVDLTCDGIIFLGD